MVASAERVQPTESQPHHPLTGKVDAPESLEHDDAREAFRRKTRDAIPARYSPTLHLGIPAVVGLGLIAASIALLRDVRWYDLLLVPIVYVMSNATEWRAHKHALHHRMRGPARILYDRHTPMHHRVFIAKDMAVRDRREFALVLLPAFGIAAIFLITAPLTIALWFVRANLAYLFVATTMSYVLSYEWLHLAYHLPKDHFVAKLGVIQRLRRHHATHHHPPLMQRWNFNVTVPLWDWVRHTTYPERLPELD